MEEYIVGVELSDAKAKMPIRKHGREDLGFDLSCTHDFRVVCGQITEVHTGIRLSLPENIGAVIRPRSGLAKDQGIIVLAGEIDPGYRGELIILLSSVKSGVFYSFLAGDRIAQLRFVKSLNISLVEKASMETTLRGEAGFNSTGLK